VSTRGATAPNPPKPDRDIQAQVLNELARNALLTPAEVGVEVAGGVVTLTGTISRHDKNDAAANAALSVSGVRDVANKLVVDGDAGEHDDTKIAHRWIMTTVAHHSSIDATTRSQASSTGLAVGAVISGGAGALSGLGGFLAVLLGDRMVPLDVVSGIAVLLCVIGLIAVALIRDEPGGAAVGMAVPPIAYAVLFGDALGSWWVKYQVAVGTSGPAENAFWSTMPAMGLLVVSGGLFALGASLAALRWADKPANSARH
jgi:hypothetical protein